MRRGKGTKALRMANKGTKVFFHVAFEWEDRVEALSAKFLLGDEKNHGMNQWTACIAFN